METLGIITVDELPENETGICVVRSHGMEPKRIDEITDKGFELVDLTCPDVKKVQQKAIQLAKEDYTVLILGKPEHPEVIAIKANVQLYSPNVFVIPDIKTLSELTETIKTQKKVGVVIQTTQKIEFLEEIIGCLLPITNELKVFNTICRSTSMRREEAKKLAHVSDLMIVVGGKNSANTTHLAELLSEITNTVHIETYSDLYEYKELIEKSKNIGVTAGASTPDNIIKKVIEELEKI